MRFLKIAGVTAPFRGYLPLKDAGRRRCGGGMVISSNSVTGLPTIYLDQIGLLHYAPGGANKNDFEVSV
jgi:hypothetical protein